MTRQLPRLTALSLALGLAFTACKHEQSAGESELQTNLEDNAAVRAKFDRYVAGNNHCSKPADEDPARPNARKIKRALVSGFGPFGEPFNISGIIAMNLGSKTFTPAELATAASERASEEAVVWRHADTTTANGGHATERRLEIDGETYDVCVLYLDVIWDLAAAIILHEASIFKPTLIVMSGVNGGEATNTFFESGAVNQATAYNGFDENGAANPRNVPITGNSRIVETHDTQASLDLTWPAAKLVEENLPLIKAIRKNTPYGAVVGRARVSNSYVCNNVSYAVTATANGESIELAGGMIKIDGLPVKAKTGFLHYPYTSNVAGRADDSADVFGWVKVLAHTIKIGTAD